MKRSKFLLAAIAMSWLAACSGTGVGGFANSGGPTVDITQLPSFRVEGLKVNVLTTLSVSEGDGYKPNADIVWRGDLFGNRYQQVQAIFEQGFRRGISTLHRGHIPVSVVLDVRQFHAITERARYTVGGTHAIGFNMTVVNAKTGDVLVPTYHVQANLKAYGGADALAAEREGLTQKVRIVDHLSKVAISELTGQAYSARN